MNDVAKENVIKGFLLTIENTFVHVKSHARRPSTVTYHIGVVYLQKCFGLLLNAKYVQSAV